MNFEDENISWQIQAIEGLDKFAKAFCRDDEATFRDNDLTFRCQTGCPFWEADGTCKMKALAYDLAKQVNYKIHFS